ncbi:hypothetical protein I4U23_007746 [Adineta vaga]|nr:hypothetical protein I4U23_007746 [Adineta vaga]
MKSILHTAHYPNLRSLELYNVDEESIRNLFTDEILSVGIFKNQVEVLSLTCYRDEDYLEMLSLVANIFEYIFPLFMKLKCLILHESSYRDRVRINFDDSLILSFRSETILILKLNVQAFDDCLYLLDGRFHQLHTLIIDLLNINLFCPDENVTEDDLPNLKYFSLSCKLMTSRYNETILPLLSRMSKLERLDLYIVVDSETTFIDRNHLKTNILNPMKTLTDFQFSITSHLSSVMKSNLSSTENIEQRAVNDFETDSIISYVDYFPEKNKVLHHIYSYPSQMTYYSDITNKFPGGIYNYVLNLWNCLNGQFLKSFSWHVRALAKVPRLSFIALFDKSFLPFYSFADGIIKTFIDDNEDENDLIPINGKLETENFSNDIFYDIFHYLDGCDIYQPFYNLNQRFHELITSSHLLLRIRFTDLEKQDKFMRLPNVNRDKTVALRPKINRFVL